ncbi:MAG TPA: hypothetical protein VF607_03485, partial [Verrucomicrobiae bacterium]
AQKLPPPGPDGSIELKIALSNSPSLQGVVLTPDGQPAPGVSLALVKPGGMSDIQVENNRLNSYRSGKVTTSDAEGKFSVPSTLDPEGQIAALGAAGFAEVPVTEVRDSQKIVLQPFGQLEVTLKVGGQPAAGKELLVTYNNLGLQSDFNQNRQTTDEQGKITYQRLLPGTVEVVRLIKTSPSSWMHSDATEVTITSGQTTQITLGGNGASVVGHLHFASTNTEPVDYQGNMHLNQELPQFNSAEESQAFFQSPAGRAWQRQQKYYALEVHPDRSFSADNLAPGTYSLNASVSPAGLNGWRSQLGTANQQITIPDNFDPAQPIDIGDIELQPPPAIMSH